MLSEKWGIFLRRDLQILNGQNKLALGADGFRMTASEIPTGLYTQKSLENSTYQEKSERISG